MRLRRGIASAALGLAIAVTAGGCGFNGIYSLPLPGAVANGGNTYSFNVQFADVLDLVPFSAVKVDGATVGHVTKITYQDGHALVGCKVLNTTHLPANVDARIEQTSILGEKFVELERPTNVPSQGVLKAGQTIMLKQTNTDVSVEEVLGALSALLSNGGVEQIHTIAQEINTAMTGRTGAARDLLNQLRTFAAGLNVQKQQIIQAISGVDTLSRTVKGQEGELIGAIDRVPPALHILTGDRQQLTTMLTSVSHLGRVAVHVINASRAGLLENLSNLRPTLDKLADVGTEIPKTLGIIITYPTADSVEDEYFGDYGNLSLTIDLSKDSLATFLKGTQLSSLAKASTTPTGSTGSKTSKRSSSSKRSSKQSLSQDLKKITHVASGTGIDDLLGLS